jgi:hypothetical protein
MPTLQPDFAQAEEIMLEAARNGSFTGQQAEWIEAFYQNVEGRMLNLYDAARLGAWRLYDRKQVATYWKEQAEWFNGQLRFMRGTETKLAGIGMAKPPALAVAIQTLAEIVEACRAASELLT